MRVLRPLQMQAAQPAIVANKRLPNCEGIETVAVGVGWLGEAQSNKRLPNCEGIETPMAGAFAGGGCGQQEAAQL